MKRKNTEDQSHEDATEIEDQGSVLDKEGTGFVAGAGAVIEEEISDVADEVMAAEETMLGRMVEHMVAQIKTMETTWDKMPVEKRETLVDGIRWVAKTSVRKAVESIAAKGRKIVVGTLDKVTIKDSIQAVLNVPRSAEACSAFGMATGGGELAFLLLETENLLADSSRIQTAPEQLSMDLPHEEHEGLYYDDNCPL